MHFACLAAQDGEATGYRQGNEDDEDDVSVEVLGHDNRCRRSDAAVTSGARRVAGLDAKTSIASSMSRSAIRQWRPIELPP